MLPPEGAFRWCDEVAPRAGCARLVESLHPSRPVQPSETEVGHESPVRAGATLLWLLVVSVAGAVLLFDGSQDGSLVGGRVPSAILWPVLWIGTLSVRRPPFVHDLVAVVLAIGGIPFVLAAPSAAAPVFVAVVAAFWVTLAVAHSTLHRTRARAAAR